MLLRSFYSVTPRPGRSDGRLPVPFQFSSDGFTLALQEDAERKCIVATVDAVVEASQLTLRPDEFNAGGELRKSGGIVVSPRPPLTALAAAVIDEPAPISWTPPM
jgi:hypothetical protein